MSTLTYAITASTSVKAYLRRQLGLSARVLTMLKEQGIQINGEHARTVDTLIPGDVLTLLIPEAPVTAYPPEDIPIQVLYEDAGFLVVSKPPYMTVYPVGIHSSGSLLNAVAFSHPHLTFRPLYRLDRNTSGALVIAKSKLAAGAMLQKKYWAICQGLTPERGVIDAPIDLAQGSHIKRAVGHGKPSVTHFTTLAQQGGHSLVSLQLETGRTHQIRVHMASIGFPLAGDDLYGGVKDLAPRQCLHCSAIILQSTAYNLHREILAPVPQDLRQAFPSFVDIIASRCG